MTREDLEAWEAEARHFGQAAFMRGDAAVSEARIIHLISALKKSWEREEVMETKLLQEGFYAIVEKVRSMRDETKEGK